MAYLEALGLGRDFSGVTALDGVDLALERGRVHVLAGENGAGKSTLVRLITGADRPSRGRILIDGRDAAAQPALFRAIAYVPQEPSLFPHLSLAENLFIPYGRSGHGGALFRPGRIEAAAAPVLERFGIRARPGGLVRDLPVAEQQLLQIARASTRHGLEMLVLDEPTSSLTAAEVERVFRVVRQLREAGRGILFISHKMDEVFAIGDDYTVLRGGRKVAEGRLADQTAAGLVHAMSGEEVRLGELFQPDGIVDDAAPPILAVEGLAGPEFGPVSFTLRPGEILGFAGLVGSGRTELMQTIFGYRKAGAGRVSLCGAPLRPASPKASIRAGIVYLPEERQQHGVFARMSLGDNIGLALQGRASGLVIPRRRERAEVAAIIAAYGIKAASPDVDMAHLSGGNQQKAIIGRALARRPRLIIFDEPTRGIDMRTKVEIYRIMKRLAEEGVGIILVSSEMAELRRCATRIIALHAGLVRGSFAADATDNETLVGAIFGQDGQQHVA